VEQIRRIGMDTSKQYFQLHGVNEAEEPILRKKLRRSEMVTFFEKLPAWWRLKRAADHIIGRACCNHSGMKCAYSHRSM
jgi:transposase